VRIVDFAIASESFEEKATVYKKKNDNYFTEFVESGRELYRES